MHSDSSDVENLELLKEAQDNDFLSDSLFKNPKGLYTISVFMLYLLKFLLYSTFGISRRNV